MALPSCPKSSTWSSHFTLFYLPPFIRSWPIHSGPIRSHALLLTISHINAVGVYIPSHWHASIQIFWEGKKYDSLSPQSPQTWQNGYLESCPDLIRPTHFPHTMSVSMQWLKDYLPRTHTWQDLGSNLSSGSQTWACIGVTWRNVNTNSWALPPELPIQ